MEKDFWIQIYKNNYEIPTGRTLAELTRELFTFLGSTDPELRDETGYTFYANWLKQDRYSIQEIRGHIKELLSNLDKGIGESENDSIFLRTFSILFLAEIVHNDNKKSFLEKSDVLNIFDKGIWYIGAEQDPRGHIPVKGWAHALAHSADLMLVLAKNKYLGETDLSNILNTVSEKITHSTNYIYIHGEDERLASAIIEVLRHDILPIEKIEGWANSFNEPDWKGAYSDEHRNNSFQNTRNLLRSIFLYLYQSNDGLANQNKYENIFSAVLKNLKPY